VFRRYLVASPRGNGCGLALLSIASGPAIALSVLPKLWPSSDEPILDLDHPCVQGGALLHIVVKEMQPLEIRSGSERLLDEAVRALTSLTFVNDDTDEIHGWHLQRLAALFQELPAAEAQRELGNGTHLAHVRPETERVADEFWAGVAEIGASHIVRTPEQVSAGEPALLGNQLFRTVPSLEIVMRDLFVAEAEKAVQRRMPDFRSATDNLPFVRGSLTNDGMRNSMLGEVDRLECSYADLDHDHPWQQVIRAAVRQVAARDSEKGIGVARIQRCRRIDRTLHDVSLVRASDLLRHRFDERALGKNRHASIAARLAVAVLRRDSPAGHTSSHRRSVAAATGLRIASPRLFELMLAKAESESHYLAENQERVRLLRGQPATKRPDLVMLRKSSRSAPSIAGADAVIDAKYKARVATTPRTMDMADQYQQFAYAATTGKRTVFIFAGQAGESAGLSGWLEVNVPGRSTEVAVGTVPFPQPGRPWVPQLSEFLGPLLAAIGETSMPPGDP
jgi:hypothetical protein